MKKLFLSIGLLAFFNIYTMDNDLLNNVIIFNTRKDKKEIRQIAVKKKLMPHVAFQKFLEEKELLVITDNPNEHLVEITPIKTRLYEISISLRNSTRKPAPVYKTFLDYKGIQQRQQNPIKKMAMVHGGKIDNQTLEDIRKIFEDLKKSRLESIPE